LEELLENVDLFSRLKFLRSREIIPETTYSLANQMKQVRNGLAHRWNIEEVNFRGRRLKANFTQFQNEFAEVWKSMIEAYEREQQKFDYEKIKSIIDQANQPSA
jgi:uncharacterized protein YutE (UPF0331/DUF86 family)